MRRHFLICGALSAFVAVAAGAFAAHALKTRLADDMLAVFEVGARYQMYHALALVLVACLPSRGRAGDVAGWAFLVGTVLFSGSLYTLALTGVRAFGAITPIGGVAFLVGWAAFAWIAVGSRERA